MKPLALRRAWRKRLPKLPRRNWKGYVSKDTYDQTEQQRKQLETSANDYKTQLEDLKKAAGDNAELAKKIEDLQAENKKKDEDHQKEIQDLKLSSAIRMAVSASAQDSDLVAGLLDRAKLILGDDGKVTGLDEQVKALKESKPFLFKSEQKPDGKKGFFPLGARKLEELEEKAVV